MLFIKRAARAGDRWTAHVAFPGGKRDPNDADDCAAAVRETFEEVGLDLGPALACGKLPDRIVTTSWGTVPLMVLCPFVFLLTDAAPPALHLQPTEVASAHWVPLRLLLDPALRTTEACDVGDRLARRAGHALSAVLRVALGRMQYSAVRLWPSMSVYSPFGADFMAPVVARKWAAPLVLWGLTLGVVEDFVDMLPPVGEALRLWRWPTFSAPDVRFVVALMARGLKQRNMERAMRQSVAAAMLADDVARNRRAECSAEDQRELDELDKSLEEMGQSGVLVRSEKAGDGILAERERVSCVNTLLEGYYDVVRMAVWVTMAGRVLVGATLVGGLVWRSKR